MIITNMIRSSAKFLLAIGELSQFRYLDEASETSNADSVTSDEALTEGGW